MRQRVLEGRICPLSGERQTNGFASIELEPHRILQRHDLGLGPMRSCGPQGGFSETPDIEFEVVTAPLPGTRNTGCTEVDIRHSWSLDDAETVDGVEIHWDTHSRCRLVELRYVVRGSAAA